MFSLVSTTQQTWVIFFFGFVYSEIIQRLMICNLRSLQQSPRCFSIIFERKECYGGRGRLNVWVGS